ncbi:hypothetical protein RB195_013208 [Necator americanus]|uniref:Uncharacterized protein n=1 Tax=Necator americanus TaxID=51031 RepID=A0ABR1DVY9_NECAM
MNASTAPQQPALTKDIMPSIPLLATEHDKIQEQTERGRYSVFLSSQTKNDSNLRWLRLESTEELKAILRNMSGLNTIDGDMYTFDYNGVC